MTRNKRKKRESEREIGREKRERERRKREKRGREEREREEKRKQTLQKKTERWFSDGKEYWHRILAEYKQMGEALE